MAARYGVRSDAECAKLRGLSSGALFLDALRAVPGRVGEMRSAQGCPTIAEDTVKLMLLVLFLGAAAAVTPLSAHHSFAAHYFEEESITIRGELVEFEYRSPHAWVYVMAPDDRGTMRRYGAEWQNPNRLGQQGITRDTLKPGDQVVVVGSPGRTAGEYKLHLKGIDRPADGWTWRGNRR